tara:strand:+ start:121 stop:1380 length:1260 start_codon:yes stop_codon:yes gene_type:complete
MAADERDAVHLNTVQRPYIWTAQDVREVTYILTQSESEPDTSSFFESDTDSEEEMVDAAMEYYEDVILSLPQREAFSEPAPDLILRWGQFGPPSPLSWYNSLHQYRLDIASIRNLTVALGMDSSFTTKTGNKYWGMEGVAIFLESQSSPKRLHEVARSMGRYSSSICEIIEDVASKIFEKFSKSHSTFQFHDWVEGQGSMSRLQVAVLNKMEAILGYSMEELNMGIFIFIDGKKKRTCRPSQHQRAAYSGYLKGHGINFQGGTLPNGISIVFLPMETARRSDPHLYRVTMTEESLAAISGRKGRPCRGYADKLYPFKEHLVRTPKGKLSKGEETLRKAFSAVRNSVEWGFGFDTNNFTGNDYFRRLKILQSAAGLGVITWVCSFFSNCIACMRGGNQVSSYFNLTPPTLEEYLRIPEQQ